MSHALSAIHHSSVAEEHRAHVLKIAMYQQARLASPAVRVSAFWDITLQVQAYVSHALMVSIAPIMSR